MKKNWNETTTTQKVAGFRGLEGYVSRHYNKSGMEGTKIWLRKRGFTDEQIAFGFNWGGYDEKKQRPRVRMNTKDIMDYEFYGMPPGTLPNITRIRTWVVNRVLRRDPLLKEQYRLKRGRNAKKYRKDMVDDLTWKFSHAIEAKGLPAWSTMHPRDDPELGERDEFKREVPAVFYKGMRVVPRRSYE